MLRIFNYLLIRKSLKYVVRLSYLFQSHNFFHADTISIEPIVSRIISKQTNKSAIVKLVVEKVRYIISRIIMIKCRMFRQIKIHAVKAS